MALGQKQTGETVNATVSLNPNTGQYQYGFTNPYDVLVNLHNAEDMIVNGSNQNDKYNLMNSAALTINAGKGNDIFVVGPKVGGLNDNIIRAGAGYDFVALSASSSSIDLTLGATSIEAVVGRKSQEGQSVTVDLGQMGSSNLTNGGSGRAFAAVIGNDGQVSVLEPGSFKFVGVVDAAQHGYTATGEAITGDALTALLGAVTQISSITGNLAAMYAGSASVPANENHISGELHAYVFQSGAKYYTVWSDGVVTPTDKDGTVLAPIYHPGAATPAAPIAYGSVDTFDKTDSPTANLSLDINGIPTLSLSPGTADAYTAINLTDFVSDSNVRGISGDGMSWFGLGKSGGYNRIFGSAGGNVYDLQTSTYLQDRLTGGKGFDVVKASADGADVDLTINGGTGFAATSIEAVVGSTNVSHLQTVELNIDYLKFAANESGDKMAVFEALLGSADDVLNLSGGGKWVEVASFAPGAALPEHAAGLLHADDLNAILGVQEQNAHSAQNSLIGHLFEQVNAQGDAIKYLTIYTDATINSELAAPAFHV